MKLISIACACLVLITSCTVDQPTEPGDGVLAPAAKSAKQGREKVDICHLDEDGVYRLISVAEPAVAAHLRHGDQIPGEGGLDTQCQDTGEITVDLPGGATMDLVWIAPGTFVMGTTDEQVALLSSMGILESAWVDQEKPAHQVTITQGFYMGKYEITQGQWEAVMGQGQFETTSNYPVTGITWDDIQQFIHVLNEAAGNSLYRLPTEAEWEYAYRGGTNTLWPSGDDMSQVGDYAWYVDNAWNTGLQYARPVGTKLPNPWGLYDVHGNVWEWCQDWYGDYLIGAQIDPIGPASGWARVFRGGSFYDVARITRSATRNNYTPGDHFNYLGFRLLRTE